MIGYSLEANSGGHAKGRSSVIQKYVLLSSSLYYVTLGNYFKKTG